MTARVIPFPLNAPFAVQIAREAEAWLVVCRQHGRLFGSRVEAVREAQQIARGFGVVMIEPGRTEAPS